MQVEDKTKYGVLLGMGARCHVGERRGGVDEKGSEDQRMLDQVEGT